MSRKKTVAFYPSIEQMAGNPYWPMLSSALEKAGIKIFDGEAVRITPGWLVRNHKVVSVLHIHYIQSLYCNGGKTRARLVYVLIFALTLIFARLLGYHTIFTLHNLTPTRSLQPYWIDYLGHWVAVNLSQRVIVHCAEARRLLAARYGHRRKVYEVAHPHLTDQYPNEISREAARELLGLPRQAVIFTFFGGIRPNKGVDILIEAFKVLKQTDYRLVIAGNANSSDPYSVTLRKMAEKDGRISLYFESVADEKVQVFMNAADVVVLPFTRILTSGSAILSMSFARPILVPRMGCLPELVGTDRGWLFEPGNSDSLAEMMQTAAASDFHRAGQNALEFIAGNDLTRFGAETICAYWE